MAGEIIEGEAIESRGIGVSEIVVAGNDAGRERGQRGVALLLTLAAVVAAAIGFRASLITASASDSWQSALRTEVKRSAAAIEDVRYLYQAELPVAIRIVQARLYEAELLSAAQGTSGSARQALLMEASVQAQVVTGLGSSSELATKPEYALSSGGLDLGKRLADLRAGNPAILALDPDGLEATGDALAHKAQLMTLSLLPASAAAFLGVLGQPFRRRRALFLRLGAVVLAGAAVMALAVELLA